MIDEEDDRCEECGFLHCICDDEFDDFYDEPDLDDYDDADEL